MKTASEMTMADVCAELRRRNDLQPIGDNFLLDLANRLADEPACKHEHGSGILDTAGNGEFTCHDCGHVQVSGRGLRDQPNGDA